MLSGHCLIVGLEVVLNGVDARSTAEESRWVRDDCGEASSSP